MENAFLDGYWGLLSKLLDNIFMKIAITVCLRHLLDTDFSLNIFLLRIYFQIKSDQISRSVVSDSLRTEE